RVELVGKLARALLAAGHEHQVVSSLCQLAGQLGTDAAGSSGHDDVDVVSGRGQAHPNTSVVVAATPPGARRALQREVACRVTAPLVAKPGGARRTSDHMSDLRVSLAMVPSPTQISTTRRVGGHPIGGTGRWYAARSRPGGRPVGR